MSFDWKRLSNRDRAIVSGAGGAFLAGFLPWWGGSTGMFGSVSVSGWSSGFTAWAGTLLLTAAGILLLLRRSGASWPLSVVAPSVLVAGVAGLGLLLVIIRWASLPSDRGLSLGGGSYSFGAQYGLYVALIAGILEVSAAVVEMRASS
jgi:hypothetical protein